MPLLKLNNFGGMIPAVDPRLLPDNQAQLSKNAWVYSGAIEGIREPVAVHTLANANARRVYRIPIEYYDKDHIPDSYWLEFDNADVDVISSPVVGDTHNRFYWASSSTGGALDVPRYNTFARIASGFSAYKLGIPAPTVAPRVGRTGGEYRFDVGAGTVRVTGGSYTHLYWGRAFARDTDSLWSGGAEADTPLKAGATRAISSTRGNMDISYQPSGGGVPANQITVAGHRAELRYGTTSAGNRITIADDGSVTVGTPAAVDGGSSTNPYEGLGVQEARAYVYTWVSSFGEEGPPSPPTLFQGWSEDEWVITLTAPTVDEMAERVLEKVRIYRTVSGATGSTTYFFVDELDIAETNYVDSKTGDEITSNNLLQSLYYEPPPADLEGFVAMPNGIIASWRGNEIWFCEPYLPHAWPSPYTLATDSPIVGMGVIGQTLIVCTTGSPYAVSGVNPASMAMSRIAVNEPCMSRASIVSTAQGVAYASPNGLALAVPGSVNIVTRNLITKDLWLDSDEHLYVRSLRAAPLNGGYYAWGVVEPGCFQVDTFQTDAFLQDDYTGAYQGAFIDFTNQRVSWTKLASTSPMRNCFADPWTGEVLTIHDGKVWWLDLSRRRVRQTYTWRSKVFESPNKRNFEAMRIWLQTDDTMVAPVAGHLAMATLGDNALTSTNGEALTVWVPTADAYGTVRVYADGVLRFTREMRASGEFMRLPSGFKAQFWEIELEARVIVTSVEMATTAKELGSA